MKREIQSVSEKRIDICEYSWDYETMIHTDNLYKRAIMNKLKLNIKKQNTVVMIYWPNALACIIIMCYFICFINTMYVLIYWIEY